MWVVERMLSRHIGKEQSTTMRGVFSFIKSCQLCIWMIDWTILNTAMVSETICGSFFAMQNMELNQAIFWCTMLQHHKQLSWQKLTSTITSVGYLDCPALLIWILPRTLLKTLAQSVFAIGGQFQTVKQLESCVISAWIRFLLRELPTISTLMT